MLKKYFKNINRNKIGTTKVYDFKYDNDENKSKQNSFQRSMEGTLSVACFLGMFPVKGLNSGQALMLTYRHLSAPSIVSLLIIIILTWTAILSLFHTMSSLIKAVSGGSGGFANATAGGIFYTNSIVSAYIFRKIATKWPDLMRTWEKHEMNVYPNPPLRIRIKIAAYSIFICALVEHFLSIIINTPNCREEISMGNSTLQGCLKEYSLRSHGFIFDTVPYSLPMGLFIFFISKVATFAWNFQDLFLIQTCIALKAKYKNINKRILDVDVVTSNIKDWRFLREIYDECCKLSKIVSDALGSLVFLSFVNNLYFICLQMLNGLTPSKQGTLFNTYFFGSFGFLIARIAGVALFAAAVPMEARRTIMFLRCCPSSAYCTEIQRLTYQLTNEEIGLSGMGFFTVDRSFILGVVGAIMTYEIVLLQFDESQDPTPDM